MKVFKFGGASVSSSEKIQNVANIIRHYDAEKLLIVVSALGKTTNALEKVVGAFFKGEKDQALLSFAAIKKDHEDICQQLGIPASCLIDFFTEVEWLLHDKPVRDFDYYYDQVVCVGELLSTTIVSEYLNSVAISNTWVDVRDIIRTDDNFRDARIDWNITAEKINSEVLPLFNKTSIVLTQGFIGATDENESTTLGREGSDYTAECCGSAVA